VTSVSEEIGFPVDVLVVDYADKLTANVQKRKKGEEGSYAKAEVIYDGLLHFAQKGHWAFTASATTRPDAHKKQKKMDENSAADSMHKVRIPDLVVSLNLWGEDQDQMMMYVAKNRLGIAHSSIGPWPVDWSIARIAPITILEEAPF